MPRSETTTAELLPDPVAVCVRINRLKEELRFARRLLRLASDVSIASQDSERRRQNREAREPARAG